jgi:hypothetical protein
MLACGCRLTTSSIFVVEIAGVVAVLDAVVDVGDVLQPDRRVVAIGNHERAVVGGFGQLVAGLDLPMPLAVLDDPLRPQEIRAADRLAHLVEGDAVLGQGLRLQLDAHRWQRAATHSDVADPDHLRDLLREHRRREVVEFTRGGGRRGQRQQHDRRLRGVDLAVLRHARQRARQQ